MEENQAPMLKDGKYVDLQSNGHTNFIQTDGQIQTFLDTEFDVVCHKNIQER